MDVGSSLVTHALAAVLVALAAGPMVWLVFGAFGSAEEDLGGVPARWTLDHVRTVWFDLDLFDAVWNSIVVTLGRAGLNVVLAALAAYPLAQCGSAGVRHCFF